jgi:rhodanese-related sulfurtransferase
MVRPLSVSALNQLLQQHRGDFALLDVRDVAEYNLSHIPGAVSLPRRLLEARVRQLAPWNGASVVMCDDDDVRAPLAAATLEALGYTDVSVLIGGINRWVTEGHSTEWGVNVPSKDFGEKVLLHQHVPEVEPDELASWLESDRKLIMLDSRTPEEHNRQCIPGSRSMPGAELGLRVWDLIPDTDTTVVVHCAGRTRSIIGAASLQRLGVPNVFALKNGTMGWLLSGREVETGSNRLDLPQPSDDGLALAQRKSRDLAESEGVLYVDIVETQELIRRAQTETVYLMDVRTADEYAANHIEGFRWVPGGQAVQATDNYVAITNAALLFVDDDNVRASMTAQWFAQMDHPNVYVLDGGITAWRSAGLPLATGPDRETPENLDAARARVATTPPAALSKDLDAAATPVIFVGTSEEFARGHVPGSHWLPRGWLEPRIADVAPKGSRIVVTDSGTDQALLAAATLLDLGYDAVALEGGTTAWFGANLPIERGLTGVTSIPNDVLPAQRSYAEMHNYLRWEEALGHKYE